ncbi:hypothetical protein C4J81_15950 [Deltaproteobacteria bacterium Smac51]|nr:hypothetical protein C4J81_15950 [Deltaproteobacteria bacterium Smac51]
MRKVLILMAGGVLGFLAKTVVEEMKWPLTVNTTTGQEGQRVPPSIFKDTAEAEPVKPDLDF